MPETIVPLDVEKLSALRGGDERALETLYRERFPSLLRVARETIPDAAHAARAVEHAFVALWSKHNEAATPPEFERLLDEALNHALARERMRGSGVRMTVSRNGSSTPKPSTAPSADVSWEHVRVQLHPVAPDPSELQALRAEARHHAVDHLASVGRRRSRLLPIALGGVAVLAIIGVLFILPAMRRDAIAEAFASPDTRSIFTKQGQLADVKLSDGTAAKLGAASRIVIPPHFTTRLRVVQLDGTASFQVAPNTLPFIVRAGRATITATGTTFAVAAYAADPKVFIQVREGSVRVRSGKSERVVTAPGSVAVDASGNPPTPIAEEGALEALGWINGAFTVKDRQLREVLPLVRRWYDLDLTTAEPSLLERRVTMQAGLDSSQAAVRALLASASLALEYQGKRAVLKNVAPAATKR